ncbi:uncharacterized protein LOC126378337 isoform X2 [Pectinophora gossypiella]|uniref:uncharacterized protein LOC126378337 isoform X2 n=1 Tax=Pectinophora gossypiella TaxID=13191 RepID=UPI00214F47D4|nr:uncharacterized protein LOC126378337 isoform X2 [Pectinophora gossypiella]
MMENMKNGSCGRPTSDQVKIRKRSRKNKSKYSFLSARLNPDFDPKNAVSQASNNATMDRKFEELDPKTMEFDTLAEFLHPTFIYDYLHKILHFLKSNQRELCFPRIAPYKEAFLVKLVQDNKHLRSRVFNEASVVVARQIIDVVERNKNVYKWIHAYEDGLLTKNVLVYKKLNLSKEQGDQFKVPCSGSPSPISIASGLEDMSLSREKQDIAPSFKLTMLNTTLKFFKDDTQLNLEYPAMSFDHAQYVYSLIAEDNGDGNVGFGFKSLCAPLKDVMACLKEKFEFKISFVETMDRLAVRMSIQKVPRTETDSSILSEKQMDLNSSNVSAASTSSESRRTAKAQKDLLSKQRLIESVTDEFAKEVLQKLVDFLKDPLTASLEFPKVQQNAGKFLEMVSAIARCSELYRYFSEPCVVLLKRLARANTSPSTWKLRLNMGRIDKATGLRTITFFKTPTFTVKCNEQLNEPPQEKRVVRQRSVSSDAKNRPTKSIAFQSAGSQVIDNAMVVDSDVTDAGGGAKKKVAGRKGRLLEAMSTPLESDRAERMMRRMGWDGGALGVRGEGIIEPIIPALHLAPGAGLGHIKPLPASKKERKEKSGPVFRLKFLQELLTFIRTPELSETTITFPAPLTKNEGSFVKGAEEAFNKRKNIGLTIPEEMALVNYIMLELIRDPHTQLRHQVSEDGKELLFKKKKVVVIQTGKKKKKSKLELFIESDAYDHNTDLITQLNKCEQTWPTSKKQAKSYRIIYLEKIKEFVASEKNIAEYQFDYVLNTKQRAFIQNVILDVNQRVVKSKYGGVEDKLFNEIRQMADCFLIVDINGQKVTLQKKFYRKRFINSALSLPPPKSADIKNTIIYKNNVIMFQGDAANLDYDNIGDGNINGDNILNRDNDVDDVMHSDGNVHDSIVHCDENITTGDNILNHDDDIGERIVHSNENINGDNILNHDDDIVERIVHSNENINGDDILNRDGDIGDSDDDVLIISENHDIISINGDDEPITNKTQETEKDSRLDDIMQDHETTKDSLSLDVSNDSMLLNMLEQENASELTTYLHIENVKQTLMDDNNDGQELTDDNGVDKVEVNNNHDVIKDRNGLTLSLQDLVKLMSESDSENGENNGSFTSSKRSRSGSTCSQKPKKCKYEKYISIISVDNREITLDLVKQVQTLISNSINENALPLLKCHGVKNGGLIYSCHSEKSFIWLKKVIGVASVKIVDTDYLDWNIRKMAMKINSFIKVDLQKCFSMLELYNPKLKTSGWIVVSEKIEEGFSLYKIGLDKHSYNYICENCFSLYAGIDKVQFSIIWD